MRGVRNDLMTYSPRAWHNSAVWLNPKTAQIVLKHADIPLGVHCYAALMAGLVECGYQDAMTTVLHTSHVIGLGTNLPVMYTTLIMGYPWMGKPHKAQRVSGEVCEDGVKPDTVAADMLAGAWFASRVYCRAWEELIEHCSGKGTLLFRLDVLSKKNMVEMRKLRSPSKARKKQIG